MVRTACGTRPPGDARRSRAPVASADERVAPARAHGRRTLHDVRADEVALDLDGSRADAQRADVAIRALDGVLAAVPVAAEELDRLVAHELRGEVRRGLRHRGLERRRSAVWSGEVHRALQQQARALEL